jgi:polyferredoxin
MACAAAPETRSGKSKKKLARRTTDDYSQKLRFGIQSAFLLLNLWIGAQFFLWVRYYESGGATLRVSRPPGVEGWLPIASLMNLKAFLLTGAVPSVHPAGMFLLVAFLGMSLLLRKSFCSWLCPVGTVSEYLWKLGQSSFRRTFAFPKWLDIPLRSLKYILLGLFLWIIGTMPVPAIRAFLEGPYGLIADVKMLNFFRFLSVTAAVTLGVLFLASIFVKNFWCRYFCPYGGLLGLVSLASPARIRRSPEACIDCAKCARACPSLLPVDRLITVKSAECTGCMECVAVCPAEGALAMTLPRKRILPAWALAGGVVLIFLGSVAVAHATGHWHTVLPERIYFELIPRAHEFSHP